MASLLLCPLVARHLLQCTPQAVCCPGYLCLRERGRARVNALLGSVWYSSIHIVLSLYTIFYDDVLRAFLSKDMDIYFTVVSCFAFLVFTFDLMLQSAVNRKFVYSFFWWLDMVRYPPPASPLISRAWVLACWPAYAHVGRVL